VASKKGTSMRRLIMLAALATLATLAATAPAAAKGPSTASITGPGLDHGLPIKGEGESGPGTPLGSLVQFGGFFAQVFDQIPDPTTRAQPTADLGPRYQVVYRVPGPTGTSTIVQDVYPFAQPSPLTYTRPGQPFFDRERTRGGWFVATAGLRNVLVHEGLPPAKAPAAVGDDTLLWPWLLGAAVLLAALGWTAWFARARWISATRTPSVS